LERKKTDEQEVTNTYIVDRNLYVTNGFLSRVINKNDGFYMNHYMPNMQYPFKTSPLEQNPLKQHQKFVFFAKIKESKNLKIDRIENEEYDIPYYRHLYNCDYFIESSSGEKITANQIRIHKNIFFTDMPDCEFFYKNERWYGLEKCTTTTAKYLIKNGAVICTYYDVDFL
jgi:hypothetical protein